VLVVTLMWVMKVLLASWLVSRARLISVAVLEVTVGRGGTPGTWDRLEEAQQGWN
jgi:hypothetical protein